ncbi:MAG TPA: hypothetical protein VD835_16525 [Pyrinomonadaceae bacterium]|nr:hypothetical protein [Pyrinomonadaceae bacterium]
MPEICVVHLVWGPLGAAQFAEFLASYREHDAGVEHDLLVLFKEIGDAEQMAAYEALLAGINYRSLSLGSEGFDILPYFVAARNFDYQYFCFLNSYSVILTEGWLRMLLTHLRRGAGVVGATASQESYYTNLSRSRPRIGVRNFRSSPGNYFAWRRELKEAREHFDPFPNYHLRTNCFALARELMLKLVFRGEVVKMDSLKFESGKEGLTRQVAALNLPVLVVGRDGAAYGKERWRESRTFRSGGQSNLLVADNRTRQYAEADAQTKIYLEQCAWGVS